MRDSVFVRRDMDMTLSQVANLGKGGVAPVGPKMQGGSGCSRDRAPSRLGIGYSIGSKRQLASPHPLFPDYSTDE